jgi:TPR repeat protein
MRVSAMFAVASAALFVFGCDDQKVRERSSEPEVLTLDLDALTEAVREKLGSKSCDATDLKPLEEVTQLTPEEAAHWQDGVAELSGDKIARMAFEYAETNEDEPDLENRTLMFLLMKSAEKESALGLNEVGAALMYCYQGVEQDDEAASYWLEKAAAKGEPLAMLSLGRLHVQRRLGERSSLDTGKKYLQACAFVGNQECMSALREMNGPTGVEK